MQRSSCVVSCRATKMIIWTTIVCFVGLAKAQIDPGKPLFPIILVPGDGGSQLEARLNKTSKVSYFCNLQSDWYTLWLDAQQILPLTSSCWADNIRLLYNSTSRTTFDNDGVEIRVPGFGDPSRVEYLNPYKSSYAYYFANLANVLVAMGYEREKNLHGAPYDFRKAPNELSEFLANVTNLVESTYAANGNQRVILVCHSMGSIMMLHLLQGKPQAWKDKYIRALVTLAGVWGGTARALKVYLLGDNLGSYFVDSTNIGLQERSNPSLSWLMPKDIMWGPDEVILQSDNLNATIVNFGEIFDFLNHTDGKHMWEDTQNLLQNLAPPNVEVYCMHGSDVPSVERLVYKTFPGSTPTLLTGDGDGTVNIRSLNGCLRWRDQQSQKVYHHVFPKVDHGEILKNPEAIEYVKRLIYNITMDITPENLDEHVLFKTAVLHNAHRHDQPALRMPNPLNVENFEAPQCRIYHEDYNGIDPTVEML